MAIGLDDVPAEGFELLVQRLGGHHVGGVTVDLQAVDVHKGAQVVQLVLGGGHGGLPYLAFGQLAVTQNGIYAVGLFVQLAGQSHTHGGRNALTQRAGGHIHAGNVHHVGVAGHMGVNGAETGQFLHGEEAAQGQNGVQSGGAVTLGQDEAVPVGVSGVGGIHVHNVEIQGGQCVQAGQRAANVAGVGLVDHVQTQDARLCGGQGKLFDFHSIFLSV